MIDLPPDFPDSYPVDTIVEERCIAFNAAHFGLPKIALQAIRRVEDGNACTVSLNTNDTADLGPMQINTIHLEDIQREYPDITFEDVACKPCLNITISAWILSKRINEVDGNVWLGVGNYHSKTPEVRQVYLEKIENALSNINNEKRKGASK